MAIVSQQAGAQLTINIRYSGENGNARKYVEEMESSGIAARIRAIEGCIRYDYFYPADDPEGLLLIDEWTGQEALDRYHSSPAMQEAAALREKYKLGGGARYGCTILQCPRPLRITGPVIRSLHRHSTDRYGPDCFRHIE